MCPLKCLGIALSSSKPLVCPKQAQQDRTACKAMAIWWSAGQKHIRGGCVIKELLVSLASAASVQLWSGHLEVSLQPARLIYPLHGAHNLSGRESCSKADEKLH